ncbi:hypothetical protein ACJX0J_024631, partial [Zea mays]
FRNLFSEKIQAIEIQKMKNCEALYRFGDKTLLIYSNSSFYFIYDLKIEIHSLLINYETIEDYNLVMHRKCNLKAYSILMLNLGHMITESANGIKQHNGTTKITCTQQQYSIHDYFDYFIWKCLNLEIQRQNVKKMADDPQLLKIIKHSAPFYIGCTHFLI